LRLQSEALGDGERRYRDVLTTFEARLADAQGETAQMRAEMLRQGAALAALGGENAQLRQLAARFEARVAAIEGSRSWRLTAPLRRLRQRLRG
jgi:hypothetical protein